MSSSSLPGLTRSALGNHPELEIVEAAAWQRDDPRRCKS
jgi:hypothetical protein